MKRIYKDSFFLAVLFAIDIVTFYHFGMVINLLVKPFFAIYLATRFYQEIKSPISRKNRLLLVSLAVMLIGELLFVFKSNILISVILILVYLIEHQLYISIFREENARLSDLWTKSNFLKMLPFILSCFIFFGYLMMPNIPDNFLLMGIIYCVQLCVVAGLAVARKVNSKSLNLVLVAMTLLILCDAATSYTMFISSFKYDYVVIRVLFLSSKVLFIYGIYKSTALSHSDKEYT